MDLVKAIEILKYGLETKSTVNFPENKAWDVLLTEILKLKKEIEKLKKQGVRRDW